MQIFVFGSYFLQGFCSLMFLQSFCEDDEYEVDNEVYSLDYRTIDGDVSLPQNSFKTQDFLPHGKFVFDYH